MHRRPAAVLCALALATGGLATLAATDTADAAGNGDTVFIDDALQTGPLGSDWTVAGTRWTPTLTTVAQNNQIQHSTNTADCSPWPTCIATYDASRDGSWLTLTSDNSQNGQGESGFVLNRTPFSSARGVVIEYDQRVYRTNNGNMGGILQGGGDGISLFLVDANPSDHGRPTEIETSTSLPGGYGAALGYSSVSNTGDAWCPAQPGLAGAYLGIGFDVYGNFQKAESSPSFGANRATRPSSVAGSNPAALNARLEQSIGLRGSGVRFKNATTCNQSTQADLDRSYGMIGVPLTTRTGHLSVFQVRWAAADPPTTYAWEYKKASDTTWTSVATELVTAGTVPGLDDSRGYVAARVPVDPAYTGSYDVRYRRTTGSDLAHRTIAVPRNAAVGTWPDASITGTTTFATLTERKGGYRWLAGTGSNGSTTTGAWIDNVKNDARQYRRIRITLTPKGDGSREVVVSWSAKLDVAADVCVDPTTKVPNGLVGSACDGTAGEWRPGTAPTFTEQFRYDLSGSQYQAAMPSQFRLGFAASTGWAVNYHQIRNLRVTSPTDVAVTKSVSLGSPDGSTTWADDVTGQAGDIASYRMVATNEGPSPLDADFPATLTDPLTAVPYANPATVTWTATATGGAEVWDPGTSTWATTVTGTGPLTGAAALRWHSPDRTTAPTAAVTVVVTGATATTAAAGTYPNTATVALSAAGGPQESDLTNNTDDATLRLVDGDTWRVAKTADPVTGATVTGDTEITYTVTAAADGVAGRGDVRGVVLTDDLSDVLDDASFVAGSALLTVGSSTPTTVADPVGTTLTTPAFTLPHGVTATLTYRVLVDADVPGGARLRNVVTGDATTGAPETCAPPADPGDTTCATHHTTPAWTAAKVATLATSTLLPDGSTAPAGTVLPDGATVRPGTTLRYRVTATNAGPAALDATLVDDLGDLLGGTDPSATFVTGSVRLTIDGTTWTGTLPTAPGADDLLEVGPFRLPAATTSGATVVPATAVLTYDVRIADDAWARTLTNAVTGSGEDPVGGGDVPPADCTPAAPCTSTQVTPVLLQVLKTGEDLTGTVVPMDGSAWALYSDAVLTDVVIDPLAPVTGSTGLFRAELAPGTYWLVETKALPGFQLLADPVQVTVAADGTATLAAPSAFLTLRDDTTTDGSWTVVVRDVPALDLPESGGERPVGLVAAGLLLVLVAGATALRTRRTATAGGHDDR